MHPGVGHNLNKKWDVFIGKIAAALRSTIKDKLSLIELEKLKLSPNDEKGMLYFMLLIHIIKFEIIFFFMLSVHDYDELLSPEERASLTSTTKE